MKVLVINPNYYRSSGVTKSIENLFNGCAQRDVEWRFVDCGYGDEAAQPAAWIAHENRHVLRLMSPWSLFFWGDLVGFIKLIRDFRPGIVHLHHRRLLLLLCPICSALRIPVVYTAHLPYVNNRLFKWVAPSAAVSVSRSVDRNVAETIRTNQRYIIGNGVVFPKKVPRFNFAEVQDTAICIGRLVDQKNHEQLLRAWSLVKQAIGERKLLIIGEGPLRTKLENLIFELGLSNCVRLVGFLSEPQQQLNSALFAVLPSVVEGQGIVTVEAAALRRATLVTDVDGSRDMVPVGARLVNKVRLGDIVALSDALIEWFSNPEKVYAEGEVFFDHHKRCHSVESMSERYHEVYKSITRD